jgi:hypothetical protein
MAKNKPKTENKDDKPKNGICYECIKAYLMQSLPCNPIVAECEEDGERWVASMNPKCGKFSERIGEPEIHPMKHLIKTK